MTHTELVKIGARYMRKNLRCSPVVTERRSPFGGEIPDVLGWRQPGIHKHPDFDTLDSYLIECKVDRADFLRDIKKLHRNNGNGLGRWRYYLSLDGVISPCDLPPKWGLLIYIGGKHRKVEKIVSASFFEGIDIMRREFVMLRSLLQEFERKAGRSEHEPREVENDE